METTPRSEGLSERLARAAQKVRSAATYERRCKECGGEFVGHQSNKVYCSAACVQRADVKRKGSHV